MPAKRAACTTGAIPQQAVPAWAVQGERVHLVQAGRKQWEARQSFADVPQHAPLNENVRSWSSTCTGQGYRDRFRVLLSQDGPADDAGASGAAGAGSSAAAGEPAEARDTLSDVESDEAEEDKECAASPGAPPAQVHVS